MNKDQFVSGCPCGCNYTLKQFRTLPFCGMRWIDDDKKPKGFEMRICICGSSRTIEVNKDGNYYG